MASEVAYINKNMLKWARSETPFADAPEVIASRLNISIERFLSWEDEASDEYPSLARAKEIAKIYKMPVAAFYLAAPPSRKSHPAAPWLWSSIIPGARYAPCMSSAVP